MTPACAAPIRLFTSSPISLCQDIETMQATIGAESKPRWEGNRGLKATSEAGRWVVAGGAVGVRLNWVCRCRCSALLSKMKLARPGVQ